MPSTPARSASCTGISLAAGARVLHQPHPCRAPAQLQDLDVRALKGSNGPVMISAAGNSDFTSYAMSLPPPTQWLAPFGGHGTAWPGRTPAGVAFTIRLFLAMRGYSPARTRRASRGTRPSARPTRAPVLVGPSIALAPPLHPPPSPVLRRRQYAGLAPPPETTRAAGRRRPAPGRREPLLLRLPAPACGCWRSSSPPTARTTSTSRASRRTAVWRSLVGLQIVSDDAHLDASLNHPAHDLFGHVAEELCVGCALGNEGDTSSRLPTVEVSAS